MSNTDHLLGWVVETVLDWKQNGIKLQPGISLDAIGELENRLQLKFPIDFKEFYQQANGCEYFGMTEGYYSLWSLERILKEYEKNSNVNYVGFCDYLINSYSFGFFKNRNGIFQEFNQFEVKGETFKQFIELINDYSDKLY
ncbi:MAG: SMI1/KNR4 family protein [Sphingobacteriales bacterium]|nr:MAG: SMI1/KNR4 family protein [Sphingobacteriales bacterium]